MHKALMRKTFLAAGLAAASVLLASAPVTRADATTDKAAIKAVDDEFLANLGKGDAAAIGLLYAPDAMMLPAGREILNGRDAIQAFWQGAIDAGFKRMTFATVEIEVRGDVAHEIGQYSLKGPTGLDIDHGKFLVIWKRIDGKWRMYRDIANSSVPAAARPAQTVVPQE